jgi:hypothetical protein
MSFMFDHRIENRDQLSHASDHSDLEEFTVGYEPFVEVSDHGVASGSDQGSHVESATHWGSATANHATAFEGTAVACERGQAHQSRDLFAIESSELGQLSDQGTASDRTDAGRTEENLLVLFPDGALPNALIQVLVGAFEFLFQPADMSNDSFANRFGGHRQAVSLCDDHLDNLSSSCGQSTQLQRDLVWQRTYLGTYRFAEVSQHPRIDAVTLGQLSGGFGEVSDLTRVDNHNGQLGTHQGLCERTFIAAGRFQHDQRGLELSQPFDQGLDTSLVVGNRFFLARGASLDIESCFGHINADKDKGIFQNTILLNFTLLQLSSTLREMRAWLAQPTVRAFGEPERDGPCYTTVSNDLGADGLSRSFRIDDVHTDTSK